VKVYIQYKSSCYFKKNKIFFALKICLWFFVSIQASIKVFRTINVRQIPEYLRDNEFIANRRSFLKMLPRF